MKNHKIMPKSHKIEIKITRSCGKSQGVAPLERILARKTEHAAKRISVEARQSKLTGHGCMTGSITLTHTK